MLKSDDIVWKHLKYKCKELSVLFNRIGKNNRVEVLIDRRDIRCVWVINPINDKSIEMGLASGWAHPLLKTYDNLPINASAWLRDVKIINKIV